MKKIDLKGFRELRFGDIVWAKSKDCKKKKVKHACIVISRATDRNGEKSKESQSIVLALSLSGSKVGTNTYDIPVSEIPYEIVECMRKEYGDKLDSISKFRYTEPIRLWNNDVYGKFDIRYHEVPNVDDGIRDYLCGNLYLFQNAFNDKKYDFHLIDAGDMVICQEYNDASANEVKQCPSCFTEYIDMIDPRIDMVKKLHEEQNYWLERQYEISYDEITCDGHTCEELVLRAEKAKTQKRELLKQIDSDKRQDI